ncbi:type 4a pilus biogenesis protein PilO [Candidatus Babeliales bacterium]|nr:type 4a pilus biogenesis protein PilO [Candidatus Babeliales bacterium]MCF7899612.1 type 4a pilus biogenesis protein PilO [Candidatus Babeliales bacterium]
MAGLLKDDRFISLCRRIPSFTRFVLSSLTLVFTFTFCYIIFYRSVCRKINEQELISKNLIQEKISFQNSLKNLQTLEKEYLSSSVNLKSAVSDYVSLKNNINSFLENLTKNSWRCYKFEPVESKNKNFYKKEYYQLKAKSNFENIINFLEDLKKDNQIIKFENIAFERKNERKNKGSIIISAKLRLIEFLNNKNG